MTPSFRYIPVLCDTTKADLRIVRIDGLSTKHGDQWSDHGVLYASVTAGGGGICTITLYADMERTTGVLRGVAPSEGVRFALAALGSGDTAPTGGAAIVQRFTEADTDIVVLPTFAVDEDVLLDRRACAQFPGYDGDYGLASVHAQAMREVLGSILPGAVPHLYPGKVGIAAYVPGQSGPALPDLRKLVNAGSLREMTALLVKAKANEQIEHLEEPAMVAKQARERLSELVKELIAANVAETEAMKEEVSDVGSVEMGSFRRG